MASLGNALVKSITSHTDAEKNFRYGISYSFSSLARVLLKFLATYQLRFQPSNYRPWWDKLEDYILYGLVMIGLITLPNSFVLGKNLECTFCKDDFCANLTFKNEVFTLILMFKTYKDKVECVI